MSEKSIRSPYVDRVARGAKLLDRVRPGWAQEIAQDYIAMEFCDQCILGQLYGDFEDGFISVTAPLDSMTLYSASEYGFTLAESDQDIDREPRWIVSRRFAILADFWRTEIRRRLEGVLK